MKRCQLEDHIADSAAAHTIPLLGMVTSLKEKVEKLEQKERELEQKERELDVSVKDLLSIAPPDR